MIIHVKNGGDRYGMDSLNIISTEDLSQWISWRKEEILAFL
jgi:hypothetical protein